MEVGQCVYITICAAEKSDITDKVIIYYIYPMVISDPSAAQEKLVGQLVGWLGLKSQIRARPEFGAIWHICAHSFFPSLGTPSML